MWIERDLMQFLKKRKGSSLPVKVLRGPRQVGKTSLLHHLGSHKLVLFDDLNVRLLAEEDPSLFFDQFKGPLILDEATLAPNIFPEIKKRVDSERRRQLEDGRPIEIDLWVTGSNQTLLQKAVRESLAGRAHYFFLNTLSIHELKYTQNLDYSLESLLMRGGWPELHTSRDLDPVHYLNDFIATFIEKDLLMAVGAEKKAAFSKALKLAAGRIGQLLNASDISKSIGIDVTTIQSWLATFEQNGILRTLPPYFSNLNKRLIKTPKIYFEDVALAVRLQGWSAFDPIVVSPYFGLLFENLVLIELTRFYQNRGLEPEIFFIRSKEGEEVDFLLQLPNQRFLAIEAKSSPVDLTSAQHRLLDSLKIEIIERWVVSSRRTHDFNGCSVVPLDQLFDRLLTLL